MLIGTHTLLPVCLGLAAENASLAKGRGHVSAVGVGGDRLLRGAAGPLLPAHFAGGTLFQLVPHAVVPRCDGSGRRAGRVVFPARRPLACWLAVLLHLIGDAVAGGISWLRPWRTDVLGGGYIPAADWLWYDIGFVLLTWLLIRLRPHAEARGMRA